MKPHGAILKWNKRQMFALTSFVLVGTYYVRLTFFGRNALAAVVTRLVLFLLPFRTYLSVIVMVLSLLTLLMFIMMRTMCYHQCDSPQCYSPRQSRRPSRRPTILLFSFFIIVIFGTGWFHLSEAGIKSWWNNILTSHILTEYHVAIFLVPTLLAFGTLHYFVSRFGHAMDFIDDFKSFPLLSPVFCFGAPSFWTKNLSTLGLSSISIKTASVLSFGSGLLFLIGVVLFHVLKNFQRPDKAAESSPGVDAPILILPDSVKATDTKTVSKSRDFGAVCLAIILLGLSLLTTVAFDLAYLISRAGSGNAGGT